MPCSNSGHHHKTWPTSGTHTLHIESCERRCGWCSKSAKTANALRAHANRHIKNLGEASLNHIKIAQSKPGRRRVALCSDLAETDKIDDVDARSEDIVTKHVTIPGSYASEIMPFEVTLEQCLDDISACENAMNNAESRVQVFRQDIHDFGIQTRKADTDSDELLRKIKRAFARMDDLALRCIALTDDLHDTVDEIESALLSYENPYKHSADLAASSGQDQVSPSESDSNIDSEECLRSQMDDIQAEDLETHTYTPQDARPSSGASEQPSNVHHIVTELQPPAQDEDTPDYPEARTEELTDVSLRPTLVLRCCSISIVHRIDLLNHFEWHEFVPPDWHRWAFEQGFFSMSAEKTRSFYGYHIRDVDAYLHPNFSGIIIWRDQILGSLSKRGYMWRETPIGAELKESREKIFNW